jgi:transposase-like protein
MPTEADDRQWNLNVQQQTAADLLALGNNVTRVAEQVGVARQTVSEWLNQNPAFEAAVNQRRQENWDNASNRLRSLLPNALDVLEQALKSGNELTTIGLLKIKDAVIAEHAIVALFYLAGICFDFTA